MGFERGLEFFGNCDKRELESFTQKTNAAFSRTKEVLKGLGFATEELEATVQKIEGGRLALLFQRVLYIKKKKFFGYRSKILYCFIHYYVPVVHMNKRVGGPAEGYILKARNSYFFVTFPELEKLPQKTLLPISKFIENLAQRDSLGRFLPQQKVNDTDKTFTDLLQRIANPTSVGAISPVTGGQISRAPSKGTLSRPEE